MDAPHISPFVLGFFRRIVRRYFRRHFTAVRLSRLSALPDLENTSLIVYANHSSWWDPMTAVLLAQLLMPARTHYAPMDAASLERYGILKKIGVFGVEMSSPRGAARFIRLGLAVLAQRGILWITPQGRFADARERPLALKPGLAALAAKATGGCTVLPLAIEYVFWNQRLPEVLVHFGEPLQVNGQSAAELAQPLETHLLNAMETLSNLAIARDPAAFHIIEHGRVGVGGSYALIQRAIAFLHRRPFQPEHSGAPSRIASDQAPQ